MSAGQGNGKHLTALTMTTIREHFKKIKCRARSLGSGPNVPAKDKFARTFELLASTFAFLDARSLRQAQLVNRYWHDIIHKSSTLEARLFHDEKCRLIHTVTIGVPSLVDRALKAGHETYDPTLSDTFRKELAVDNELWVVDGASCSVHSLTQYHSLLGHVLASCETVMLCYTVDSRESFQDIKTWLTELNSPTEPLSMLVATHNVVKRKNGTDKCVLGALVACAGPPGP